MRYIYIVTRTIVRENKKYGIPIPNLGVHTNLKAAIEHFESVKLDRTSKGYKCLNDRYLSCYNQVHDVGYREALLEEKDEMETLYIERWKI